MTNVTTILSNESGIQYQGVNDASSITGTYPAIGLIVGQFLGGRTDKPMTITNANIKTLLGYDPTNPNYVAVQDVLNSGVPSVQVLRVTSELKNLVCITDYVDYQYWRISLASDGDLPDQEYKKMTAEIFDTLTISVGGIKQKIERRLATTVAVEQVSIAMNYDSSNVSLVIKEEGNFSLSDGLEMQICSVHPMYLERLVV